MRSIGRFLWLVISVVTVIISMAFAASNDSEVTLHLWPFETGLGMPVWLAVLGAFGAESRNRWIYCLAFNYCDSHLKLAHAEKIKKNGKTDEGRRAASCRRQNTVQR